MPANCCAWNYKEETHHEMKIPERDVTYTYSVLSVYLLTFIHR